MIEYQGVDLNRLLLIANVLASQLPTRCVVGLRGTLGAGKTRFVQAFASAAGVPEGTVTSPTFTIVHHYHGTRRIHHVDAYRLVDEDEFVQLGGEELFEDEAIVFVEWPERIARCIPTDAIWIDLSVEHDAQKRTIRFTGGTTSLLASLANALTRS